MKDDLNQNVNVVDGDTESGEDKSEIRREFVDDRRKNLIDVGKESDEGKKAEVRTILEDDRQQSFIGNGRESDEYRREVDDSKESGKDGRKVEKNLEADRYQNLISDSGKESVQEKSKVRRKFRDDTQQYLTDDSRESIEERNEIRKKLEEDVNQNLTDSGRGSLQERHGARRKPEIVGVTYKKSATGRTRGLLMLNSALSMDESTDYETQSVYSTDSETFFKKSWPDSFTDTNEEDDNITDFDINLFTGSLSKGSKGSKKALQHLHGIHDFEENPGEESLRENESLMSLRSVDSWPSFLGNGNMKKWNNQEDLNDISLNSGGLGDKWVIGDYSDTGMSEHLLILLLCVCFLSFLIVNH